MEAFLDMGRKRGQRRERWGFGGFRQELLQVRCLLLDPLVQMAPGDERLHSQRVVELLDWSPFASNRRPDLAR